MIFLQNLSRSVSLTWQVGQSERVLKPNADSPDRFNGGFMMFAPNKVLFEHYMALLNTPDSFDSTYMEQSLLNQAHKESGAMPFTRL